jgi:anti-anti-sigma factor
MEAMSLTAAEPFFHSLAQFALPRPRSTQEAPERSAQQMRLRVRRPRRGTAVVTVRGEVDQLSAPRLREMLSARLRGTLDTLVIDLSGVEFLGTAGLSALIAADLLARQQQVDIRIVTGDNRCVIRALRLTGLIAAQEDKPAPDRPPEPIASADADPAPGPTPEPMASPDADPVHLHRR